MATLTASPDILSDRMLIEDRLAALLPATGSGAVAKAMRYAVLGPGQRLRPLLALRVARVLGRGGQGIFQAAEAIELLHCASLIVDDLPCMDNDAFRRNRPAVHVKFGEATAVLAAFALVGLAAKSVADQSCFQVKLLGMLDCDSLIGGQALDLETDAGCRDNNRLSVAALKTVPLFQLAAEAGCLAPGVPLREREAALTFGREFGFAYQTVDDYLDGEIVDLTPVTQQFASVRTCLDHFGDRARHFEDLLDHLNAKIWEDGRSNR